MYTRSYTTERDGRTFVVHVLPDAPLPEAKTRIGRKKGRGRKKNSARSVRAAITRSNAIMAKQMELDRQAIERAQRDP